MHARETPQESGEELFRRDPNLMLVEVFRKAYSLSDDHDEILEFVDGYVNARKRKHEFDAERGS